MNIPKKRHRKLQIYKKTCHEPGCDVGFSGFAMAKYCKKHRDPKNRAKKAVEAPDHSKNVLIKHKFDHEVIIEKACGTCGTPYPLKLTPKQYVYPGMCEKHRR